MTKKIIQVVAAAIKKDGRYFCAQRPENKSLGGLWEFPGGKLETGEAPEVALIREIKEEFDADIEILNYVNKASYDYDFGTVVMTTYEAKLLSTELTLLEHQNAKWLAPEQLHSLKWAPVDLPAVYLLNKGVVSTQFEEKIQ
ncbi:MAG: (deoxy)nucleoside triphosphate pyrophosphohydrolase [Aerococcaceae bacterium]|nr:(deoxy)nucleoside triphosphate pyrophosphohydrolase [Aerococcaceae bacterium]